MNHILITGGAGYIGSHVLRLLARNSDYEITVIDNLEKGFKQPIDIIIKESKARINFIKLDLCSKKEFGWKPKYTLEQAVESLVKWFKKNPNGYEY